MGHKRNDIKAGKGKGSIKVGATGKVSALITRELEDCNAASPKRRGSPDIVAVSVCCGVSASANSTRGSKDQSGQAKLDSRIRSGHHIPMLDSKEISVDSKTLEDKTFRLVEIVDLKCGRRKPGKVCFDSIDNNAKKLSFSRLSVSNKIL